MDLDVVKRAHAKLASLELELARLQAENQQLQLARGDRDALIAAQARAASLETELARAEEANEELMARATQRVNALEAENQTLALASPNAEAAALEARQLGALLEERDGELALLLSKYQSLKVQVEGMQGEHDRRLAEAAAAAPDLTAAMSARLEELHRQLAATQERAHGAEAGKAKYKDAVRALKLKLVEKDGALAAKGAQIAEMHTELLKLQTLLQAAPDVLKSSATAHAEEAAELKGRITALEVEVADKGAPTPQGCVLVD